MFERWKANKNIKYAVVAYLYVQMSFAPKRKNKQD